MPQSKLNAPLYAEGQLIRHGEKIGRIIGCSRYFPCESWFYEIFSLKGVHHLSIPEWEVVPLHTFTEGNVIYPETWEQ